MLGQVIADAAQLLTPRPDVISVFVRQGDELVLCANVGLELGGKRITMKAGEGLTGSLLLSPALPLVAMDDHPAAKAFASVGEDRFPAYLGLAVPPNAGARAVVVFKRRTAFASADGFKVAKVLAKATDWSEAAVRAAEPELARGLR